MKANGDERKLFFIFISLEFLLEIHSFQNLNIRRLLFCLIPERLRYPQRTQKVYSIKDLIPRTLVTFIFNWVTHQNIAEFVLDVRNTHQERSLRKYQHLRFQKRFRRKLARFRKPERLEHCDNE